jgi:hypothetical protein
MTDDQTAADFSLVQYARYHGLAIDHQADDLLEDYSEEAILDLELASPKLPEFEVPPFEGLLNEPKFTLDDRGRVLLASCIRCPDAPSCRDALPRHHSIRNLKLELPLLMTDHTLDMRRFTSRPSFELRDLDLGLFVPDSNMNDILPWPAEESFNLAPNWDKEMAREKLRVSKEALLYVQDTLRIKCEPTLFTELMKENLEYQEVSRL